MDRARLGLLLHLTAVACTSAWSVGYEVSADVLSADTNIVRWSIAPAQDGRQAHIAWALAPGVCDEKDGLLRLIPEEAQLSGAFPMPKLFDCDAVRRSIRKAMKAWETANSNIRFFDVSSLCVGQWTLSPPASVSPMPPPPPSPPPSAECHGALLPSGQCLQCPHAQLVIATFTPTLPLSEPIAVQIRTVPEAPLVGTANYKPGQWHFIRPGDTDPELCRKPSECDWQDGFPPLGEADGSTIISAALLLSTGAGQCYWSDADICGQLFRAQVLHAGGLNVLAALDAGFYGLFAIGLLLLVIMILLDLYRMLQTILLSWDTDGDGVVEFHEVRAALLMCMPCLGRTAPDAASEGQEMAQLRTSGASAASSESGRLSARDKAASFLGRTRSRPALFRRRSTLSVEALREKKIRFKDVIYGILDTVASIDYFTWCCALLLIIYPLGFRAAVVRPCFDCDDLSATLTRGVGRVLGLYGQSSPRPTDEPGGPAEYYFNSSSSRYNCSEPLAGVIPLSNTLPPGASLMGTPTRASANAADWTFSDLTTLRCPTEDDAAGLRVLYPECDQLLSCQYNLNGALPPLPPSPPPRVPQGSPVPPPPPLSLPMATEGCVIYGRNYTNAQINIDVGNLYIPADYYAYGLTDVDDELQLGGRVVAAPRCYGTGDMEHTGVYRSLILLLQTVVLPLCIILGIKLIAIIIRAMPVLRDVRSRNRALKRTATLRRAEVRRMSEGGQKFIIKRLANQVAAQGRQMLDKKEMLEAVMAKLRGERRLSNGSVQPSQRDEPGPVWRSEGKDLDTLNRESIGPAPVRPAPVLDVAAPGSSVQIAAALRSKLQEAKERASGKMRIEGEVSNPRMSGASSTLRSSTILPTPSATASDAEASEAHPVPRRARIDPSPRNSQNA